MKTIVIAYETILVLLFSLPRFRFFTFFKVTLLKVMGAKIGKNVCFYPGVWIMPGRNLELKDNVVISKDVILTTSGGILIGNDSLVGYRTQILSINHSIPQIGDLIPASGDTPAFVEIGNNVWIGANCVILPGVRIGNGAVVGAGSIVTKDIPDYCIAVGVPAKVIRKRDN